MAESEVAAEPRVEQEPGMPVEGIATRLPQVPEPQAVVMQALFRQPRRWSVEGGGELVLEPGEPAPEAEAFAVDSDGARLVVAFDPRDGSIPDAMHWSDHEGRARVLAWSLAHEQPLVRLSQALGMALIPVVGGGDEPVAEATAGEGAWLRFLVRADGAGEDISGLAWFPLPRLRALLARADAPEDFTADRVPAGWLGLPVPVVVSIHGPRVPQAEWRGLVPGAVIVAGRVSHPPQVRARAAGRSWPLQPSPGGWRIEGPAVPDSDDQEKAMSEDEQQAGEATGADAAAAPDPVSGLPVQVQFELGRLEVALSDLAQLQPGYVFALPAHLQGANVAIRANGREVGRGELVAVGDTLGVRLVGWS